MPDTWNIFLFAFIIDIMAENYYMYNYKKKKESGNPPASQPWTAGSKWYGMGT